MTDTPPTQHGRNASDDAPTQGGASASQSPSPPESDVEPYRLSRSPTHLLRRAQQYAAENFGRAGGKDAVTLRQAVVLAAIAEAEGGSQADLVNATGVDRSTLAEMIARMERKGLIARAPALGDLRAKAVRLTPAGRTRLEASLPLMRAADERLIATLPKSRRAAFADMLSTLAQAGEDAAAAELVRARAEKAEAKARKARDKTQKAKASDAGSGKDKSDKARRKLRKKLRRKLQKP